MSAAPVLLEPAVIEEQTLQRPDGATAAVQVWPGPGATPVLLLHGAASSSTMWPPGFVAQLARTRPVLLLDFRDAGRSSRLPEGPPDYTASDLVDDAVDAIGGPPAHVVGLSMGGGIARWLALARPDLVRSLVLMSTSAIVELPGLPAMDPSLFDEAADTGDDAVARLVEGERPFLGAASDEPEQTAAALRMLTRADDVGAAEKHLEVQEPDAPVDLTGIRCPVLVVHGDADRLFPLPHA